VLQAPRRAFSTHRGPDPARRTDMSTPAAEPFSALLREIRAREPMSEDAAARAAVAVLSAVDVQLAGEPGPLANLLRACPLHFPAPPEPDAVVALVASETGLTRHEAERLAKSVFDGIRARVPQADVVGIRNRLGGLAAFWS
jgi:hypothetical protein